MEGGSRVPHGVAGGGVGVVGWGYGRGWRAFPLVGLFRFVVEGSLTLARRILTGQRFWLAHREHLYQRLVLAGMSHRALALRPWALLALCAVPALVTRQHPGQAWAVTGVLCGGGLGWGCRGCGQVKRLHDLAAG